MTRSPHPSFRRALASLATLALLLSGTPGAWADRGRGGGGDDEGGGGRDRDELKLRVNDAIGAPGGTVAVVLRTYAARPIRQGRISLRVRKRTSPAKAALTVAALTEPVRPVTLLGVTVYSQRRDAKSRSTVAGAPDSQAAQVDFSSPSGTVNASDGPLAVFRFRLSPAVSPGQEYLLEIDPSVTSLVDGGGRPIAVEPLNAVLTVRAPSSPFAVEAEGDEVEPGETAELGVSTFEPFPVSGGRVTLLYNPAVAAGAPAVTMDPRYGRATFTVDRSRPGVLVVTFQSPDKTLNTVPGDIVAVTLPTRTSAPLGMETRVSLDPAGTYLLSKKGRKLKLALEDGTLAFE
jgi:hypothetical protein